MNIDRLIPPSIFILLKKVRGKSIDDNIVITSYSNSKGLLRINQQIYTKGGHKSKSHNLPKGDQVSLDLFNVDKEYGDPKGNLLDINFPK